MPIFDSADEADELGDLGDRRQLGLDPVEGAAEGPSLPVEHPERLAEGVDGLGGAARLAAGRRR